jgi:hypothetical protein
MIPRETPDRGEHLPQARAAFIREAKPYAALQTRNCIDNNLRMLSF